MRFLLNQFPDVIKPFIENRDVSGDVTPWKLYWIGDLN
jgi:hypothetical protein